MKWYEIDGYYDNGSTLCSSFYAYVKSDNEKSACQKAKDFNKKLWKINSIKESSQDKIDKINLLKEINGFSWSNVIE